MNIVYVNLVPQKNDEIHSFLSDFADYVISLKGNVDISVKNAEDLFPGVNSYIEKILKFYGTKEEKEIRKVNAFFEVLNNHHSINEVKSEKLCWEEDESTYEMLDEGFKRKFSFKNFKIVVISGHKYDIPDLYGVAIHKGNVCINRCLKRESIWHETAHLFGADDHYDKNDKNHPTTCGDKKCLMQWDARGGNHFCKKAIEEINEYTKTI